MHYQSTPTLMAIQRALLSVFKSARSHFEIPRRDLVCVCSGLRLQDNLRSEFMLPSVGPDLVSCSEFFWILLTEIWQIIILCRASPQCNLHFPLFLVCCSSLLTPPPPRQTTRLKTDTVLMKSSGVRQHHVRDQRAHTHTRCLLVT